MTLKKEWQVSIASPPDREKLVAEIMFGDEQFAELNQEGETLTLEIYPRPSKQCWGLEFDEVISALHEARKRLTGE